MMYNTGSQQKWNVLNAANHRMYPIQIASCAGWTSKRTNNLKKLWRVEPLSPISKFREFPGICFIQSPLSTSWNFTADSLFSLFYSSGAGVSYFPQSIVIMQANRLCIWWISLFMRQGMFFFARLEHSLLLSEAPSGRYWCLWYAWQSCSLRHGIPLGLLLLCGG